MLFDSVSEFPLHVEKIERFCLPLFAAADSRYAVDHVLENFLARPSMTQIYCAYLAKFLDNGDVVKALAKLVTDDELLYDWQRMWIFAAMIRSDKTTDGVIRVALRTYADGARHEALRAVAAITAARHGSFSRHKELADNYGATGSPYLQTAVLYSARYFQKQLRRSSVKAWSAHSQIHQLVAKSIEKM